MATLSFPLPAGKETVAAGAAVDASASRDGKRLLVHLINRYRDAPVKTTIRFEGFDCLPRDSRASNPDNRFEAAGE